MSSSNSSAGPHYAQILLPPGVTLDEYFALQREISLIAIATSCALAIGAWDYLNLLPLELAVYRNMKQYMWTKPTIYAFVILRYSVFMALLSGLWFTVLENNHCQVAASFSQAGVVLVTASAGVIFCYRVFSIWTFKKIVCIPVAVLYLLMVGCWLAVATQLGAFDGPHVEIGSNCRAKPVPAWSPIGFASSVAFDTVVLIFTVAGLRGRTQTTSRMGRLLLNDNIIYFILVTVTNLVVLVIQSSNNDLLKPVVLPYPTIINTAMGTRVFLNLKLMTHHPDESVETASTLLFSPLGTTSKRGLSSNGTDNRSRNEAIVLHSRKVIPDSEGNAETV